MTSAVLIGCYESQGLEKGIFGLTVVKCKISEVFLAGASIAFLEEIGRFITF